MFSLVCGSIGVTLQVVAQGASLRQFFGAREAYNSVIDKKETRYSETPAAENRRSALAPGPTIGG
jgi:hypothetical protein